MNDTISRQDAINALVEKGQESERYKLGEFWELNFEEIQEALATVPSAEPRWIPVSERLPEEDCETGKGVQYSNIVLMSVEHKEDEETIVDYGHTVDGKWYSDYTDCFIPQEWKVIAWMQLPEPYKASQTETGGRK